MNSCIFFQGNVDPRDLRSFPTRRSSDLPPEARSSLGDSVTPEPWIRSLIRKAVAHSAASTSTTTGSEEHTSELQSHVNLVCRLLLEKKKHINNKNISSYNFKC